MRKKTKKLSKPMRDQLRYLVEEFLEKSGKEIDVKIASHRDAAKTMWERLESILFFNIFWMDEPDSEDMADLDYEKLLKEFHAFLKPIWDQFRDALFEYKHSIIPERAKLQKLRETIDRDKASPLYEYKELFKQQDGALDLEMFHDITLKESFEPSTLTVSFESGRVSFYKRNLNLINNFIDLLSGVDIEYLVRCEHCGKCIIVSRAGKRFCPGCSAKKFQKEKWDRDPEGMKEKERVRYQETRKK
jgi:hypothetical protein